MQHQTPKSRRNLHVTIYPLIQRLFRLRLIYDYSVLRVLHSAVFWLNLDCFWLRCTKLKFASRIGTTRDFRLSDSFYSTILHFRAMSVPFQTETRASKRKLSSQSDLQNTYAFSQNSSLSISNRQIPVEISKKTLSQSKKSTIPPLFPPLATM